MFTSHHCGLVVQQYPINWLKACQAPNHQDWASLPHDGKTMHFIYFNLYVYILCVYIYIYQVHWLVFASFPDLFSSLVSDKEGQCLWFLHAREWGLTQDKSVHTCPCGPSRVIVDCSAKPAFAAAKTKCYNSHFFCLHLLTFVGRGAELHRWRFPEVFLWTLIYHLFFMISQKKIFCLRVPKMIFKKVCFWMTAAHVHLFSTNLAHSASGTQSKKSLDCIL